MFLCFCFESGDFWFFLSNIQQFWRMLDIDLKPAPTLLYLQFWCLFCLMLCARSLLAWPSELEVGEGWTNWLITAPPHPPKSLTEVPTGGRCSSKVCWDNVVSPEPISLLLPLWWLSGAPRLGCQFPESRFQVRVFNVRWICESCKK